MLKQNSKHSNSPLESVKKCKLIPDSKRSNSPLGFLIENNIFSKPKRSQSQVISTVLLIMLVVISMGIIIAFVIPFVIDALSGSECLEVMDQIKIRNNPQYSCYNATSTYTHVQVHVGDILDKIEGFTIELSGATSRAYEINNSNSPADVSIYGGGVFELPNKNEERTYVFEGFGEKPDVIRVYPILLSGTICKESDTLTTVKQCFKPF